MNQVQRSRWYMAAALGMAILGCAAMLVLRASVAGWFNRSLAWNLFLAAVPFPLAWWVDALSRQRRVRGWMISPLGVLWLLFFPNSPYLVTDLVHLRASRSIPLWFDALVYFAFAATGLLLGFTSLYLVQASVARRVGAAWGWLISTLAIALGAYGIYLGRVERWNSWDVITSPRALVDAITSHVEDPLQSERGVLLVLGFVVFMTAVYLVLYAFANLVRADARVEGVDGCVPASGWVDED